jgi:toxin ParE1/3/4
MQVIWSEQAVADLAEIRQYIARDKPSAARRVATRIKSSVRLLARHPHAGRVGSLPGTREYVIAGLPYIVPYVVEERTVIVLAVNHGAMIH